MADELTFRNNGVPMPTASAAVPVAAPSAVVGVASAPLPQAASGGALGENDKPNGGAPALPEKRKGGRKRDEIWREITVAENKNVICNKCQMVIHRYGYTKVERVRAHFETKCLLGKRLKPMPSGDNGGALAISPESGVNPNEIKLRKSEYMNKIGVFKRRFAQWIYSTGQTFDDVENKSLLRALKVLRADVAVPTKEELENDLLDMEYQASITKVHKMLAGKACCLAIDNWIDVNGNSVTNYSAICENVPYYLESSPSESPEPGVEEIETILTKHKKAVFYGVVAPVATAITRATREKILKKNPQCVFYHGCVCHALHLLINDMCTILPWLSTVHDVVVDMVKLFQGNSHLRSMERMENRQPIFDFSNGRRPTSICESMESILKAEKELYAIVSRRDFVDARSINEQETLKRIQDFVLGETFVQDLVNALNILRPLQEQLARFESDRASMSQVYPAFLQLLEAYASMEGVNKKEKALISSCVNERFNAIYGDTHGVAYMLDPLFLGRNMDPVKKQEVENFIVSYCEGQRDVNVLDQLEKYKDMIGQLKDCNEAYWKLLIAGEVRLFDFWTERRQFPHLQQLAWVVFSLPVASTAPSKTFGPQGFYIHSKFHDQLPNDKLQQLTHVFCNAKKNEADPTTSMLVDADPINSAFL